MYDRVFKVCLSAVVTASLLAGCGGGGSSAAQKVIPGILPSASPSPLVSTVPEPVNSASSKALAYLDNGDRTPVPGLAKLPVQANTVEPQSLSAGTPLFWDQFEDAATTRWTTVDGSWALCHPFVGASQEYCSTSNGDESITTASTNGMANYRIDSWVRLQAGDGANASIVSRFQDQSHFYELELRTYNGVKSWMIWKNNAGTWSSIAGGNYTYVPGTYYRLRLDSFGSTLSAGISTDGLTFKTLGSGTDSTYANGSMGLRVYGNASTSFDGVYVAPLTNNPAPAPTAAAGNPSPTVGTATPVPTSMTATNSNGQLNLVIPILIPNGLSGIDTSSYVSPAVKSISIAVPGGSTIVVPVGSGLPGCSAVAGGISCSISYPVTATMSGNVYMQMFASTNGSGTPLAIRQDGLSVGGVVNLGRWWPVVASLAISQSAAIEPGMPSAPTITVTPSDASGTNIPFGSYTLLDAKNNALTISLADSDTTGSTQLGSTTYTGQSVPLNYNGGMPFPTGLTITATAKSGAGNVGSAALAINAPAPSNSFTYTVGPESIVPNSIPAGIDGYRVFFPDSHFSVLKETTSNQYAMYWGTGNLTRSLGPDQFAQDQGSGSLVLDTVGQTTTGWQWASAASWMNSVTRVGTSNTLIGFIYGDDVAPGDAAIPSGTHWNNTGVSYSYDNGMTWTVGQRIWTDANSQPFNSVTGPGEENGIAVWDIVKHRWFAMNPDFSNGYTVALSQSTDPNASPGTWYKYYNGSYSQPAMGGQDTGIPILGSAWNPSLFWDSYLAEWVLIGDDIQGNLYIQTSKTLDDWTSTPRKILAGDASNFYQYPTAIGIDDKLAGQTFTLYYANFPPPYPQNLRKFAHRTITLNRND